MALFTYAFRSLFLLAVVYAIIAVPYWGAAWLGAHSLPTQLGAASAWHAHEMIFGFAGAAVGGFALTAVATWTRRPPVAGAPLLALGASWLLARVLFVIPSREASMLAALLDLAFGLLLFALMSREVVSARNQRNYKVLVLLGLLPLSNALFFWGAATSAPWLKSTLVAGVWLLVLMINVIGGRVIPGFTRNWLRRQVQAGTRKPSSLPPTFDRFDLFCSGLLTLFAAVDIVRVPGPGVPVVGFFVAGMLFIRLLRWQGLATLDEPLVWVLHLAYAWIPVGLVLLSASALGVIPRSAGIHALTSGAVATMVLAIAGRAALGHTGRPLESHPLLTASYLLITVAAVCRVAATFGSGARILFMVSIGAWSLGFLCFLWRYAPILVQPAPVPERGGRRLPTA